MCTSSTSTRMTSDTSSGRRPSRRPLARLAVGVTVILLTLSPFSRRFNRDEERTPAKGQSRRRLGSPPPPLAFHTATAVSRNRVVIYGGRDAAGPLDSSGSVHVLTVGTVAAGSAQLAGGGGGGGNSGAASGASAVADGETDGPFSPPVALCVPLPSWLRQCLLPCVFHCLRG